MPDHCAAAQPASSTSSVEIGLGLAAAGLLGAGAAAPSPVAPYAGLACVALGLVLAVRGWTLREVAPAALAAAVGALCLAALVGASPERLVVGVLTALLCAGMVVIAPLVGDQRRRRREFTERGWELARTREEAEEVRLGHALSEERAAMASEVHDGLGHRLTLVAVRASKLSLDPSLTPDARAQVQQIRADVAAAAAAVGDTVHLLTGPSPQGRERTVQDVLDGACGAGLPLTAQVTGVADLGGHSRAAVVRVVREALTNAARHGRADGDHPVEVKVGHDGTRVAVEVRNRVAPEAVRSTDGTGLLGLRHRLGLLGGQVSAQEEGSTFVLVATLPVDAQPSRLDLPEHEPLPTAAVSRDLAARGWTRSRRALWAIPSALALTTAVVAAGYLALTTTVGVLGEGALATLSVGQSEDSARAALPPLEMLEPPRDALPEPAGAQCRYYEDSVSWFVREDVHRICFADGVLTTIDTIPAP